MNPSAPDKGSAFLRRKEPVLLVILSVISLVALFSILVIFNKLGKDEEFPERFNTTTELDVPLLAYKAATGAYPTTKQGLEALLTQPDGVTGWRGPYLIRIPLDPWKRPYQYAYPSTHGQAADKYDVWSLGPDGIDETKDDIGNWQN